MDDTGPFHEDIVWMCAWSFAGKARYQPRQLVIFTMFTKYFMVIHTK